MPDFHYDEMMRLDALVRHYAALIGYTREAVIKAIREIREDYADKTAPMSDVMLKRADEIERHLEAIEETIQ